ncbi:MAG: hypothetical protein ABID84_05410 [Chloroflexota bacterium]
MNGSSGIETFRRMIEVRETKRKELKTELDALDREIESIQLTQALYMKEHGIPTLSEQPLLEHGLSLTKKREKALREWAERNNGILIPKEAKHALIAAGLVKTGKGAGWIVYGTINNMECWEKIHPGKYRLVKLSLPQEDGRKNLIPA